MKPCFRSLVLGLLLIPLVAGAQGAEKQVSFAQTAKPHSYYVKQAELWWREVQKNKKSEEAWYNYFRACRNAQGTANWRTDFVQESPYLKPGDAIVRLIGKAIPNTFTYYYLSYLSQGVGTDHGADILKAYALNPAFEGIQSSVISYAISSVNDTLQKRVNKEWAKTGYFSPQFMNYAYNVLMSLDSNAVLLTVSDNDTYPLLLLQDAFGVRTDVRVYNVDVMLTDHYRNHVFEQLHLPPLEPLVIDLDVYERNWAKVVSHILTHTKPATALYLDLMLPEKTYKEFEDKMAVAGLALKYNASQDALTALNKHCYEEVFELGYLRHPFCPDRNNQGNIDQHNLSYLNFLKVVYDRYRAENNTGKAAQVRSLALDLADRVDPGALHAQVEKAF